MLIYPCCAPLNEKLGCSVSLIKLLVVLAVSSSISAGCPEAELGGSALCDTSFACSRADEDDEEDDDFLDEYLADRAGGS